MKIIERNVSRRAVIEEYVNYDCSKTTRRPPRFETSDWSHPDLIDERMRSGSLKVGVLAGYELWNKVELTLPDLRNCAVEESIFPARFRMLGQLETAGDVAGWQPNRRTQWLGKSPPEMLWTTALP